VKQSVFAGALALLMLAQHPAPAQQQIPDAPKPQPLPPITNVTPGIGTTSTSVGDASTSNTPADPNADAPKLTNSTPVQHEDDGPAPEVVTAGQGPKVFTLPRANVNFVQTPFTVKDSKGRLVPGIDWREVRIYENGVRQQMAIFTSDPFPLSLALVIDQSVTFDTMERINNALEALPGAFAPYDDIAIFTYNNGAQMQTDFTAATGNRAIAVLERSKGKGRDPIMGLGGPLAQTTTINNENFDPNTAPIRNQSGMVFNAPKELHTLNDAIFAAAVALTKTGRGRRRVIYVISDGKEYGSKVKFSEVVHYLQAHEIQVYATIVGDSSIPVLGFLDRFHLPLQMRDDILPRYAAATGGQTDSKFRTREIAASFAEITRDVRTQYTVGYYSREPFIDGKFRKTEVRVLRPNLTVVARDGYYPAAVEGTHPVAPAPQPASAPSAATPPPSN
jgi:VWFA-related protein